MAHYTPFYRRLIHLVDWLVNIELILPLDDFALMSVEITQYKAIQTSHPVRSQDGELFHLEDVPSHVRQTAIKAHRKLPA
jgi:hypothetical protein